jgi:hypothetical protein
MKRAALCILLLVLCVAFASADRLMFLGAGGSYATENRETLPPWSGTSVAFHLGGFSGKSFGLYYNMSLGYILGAKTGGVPIDVTAYDFRLSIESVFGVGYRIPIHSPMLAIVGAGLYFGMVTMFPYDSYDPSYGGSFTLGPGIQAMVTFPVRPGLHAGVSLGAAYGLFEPLPLDELTQFNNGIHVFGGVGIAFTL